MSKSWWSAAALVLAVGAGFALRMTPCLLHPGFEFVLDSAYHERLTRQVVEHGRLAPIDVLSDAPEGRATADHLPVGLYYTSAVFHRVLSAFGSRDLRWNLAILVALAGALCAVPVGFAAFTVFHDPRAAALAACLVAFLPAHIERTDGLALRYDALGTLWIATHLALALAALAESRPGRRRALALAAAVAFAAAMSTWRVSLLVIELEAMFAALIFLVRGAEPALRDLWCPLALAGTLGLLPIVYLSRHGFLVSPIWLGVLGLALLLAIPRLGPASRWPLRFAALAAVAALAFALGRMRSAIDYEGLASLLRLRFGLAHGHNADAALMQTVVELKGLPWLRLLIGQEAFSWLGLALLVSPLLFVWLARGHADWAKRRLTTPVALLAFLCVGLAGATLLFQRSAVLLAPPLAIVIGGLLARSWHAEPRPARWFARLTTLAIVGGAAALAMVRGFESSRAIDSRLAPNLRAAIEYLRAHAAPGTRVMCDWDAGYTVQSEAGLATAVDGLLESSENRARIVELYAGLMDPGSGRLDALDRKCGASWLLLPTGSAIYAMASVTGDPLAQVIASGATVPRGPLTDHLIVHLIEGDRAYPELRRVLESGGYTVFEVMGTPAR